ncbi:protein of unknown function [Cupriavidus taiwanensis]|nr:protein of unknown function [Cupriavidus taiwanensis]
MSRGKQFSMPIYVGNKFNRPFCTDLFFIIMQSRLNIKHNYHPIY